MCAKLARNRPPSIVSTRSTPVCGVLSKRHRATSSRHVQPSTVDCNSAFFTLTASAKRRAAHPATLPAALYDCGPALAFRLPVHHAGQWIFMLAGLCDLLPHSRPSPHRQCRADAHACPHAHAQQPHRPNRLQKGLCCRMGSSITSSTSSRPSCRTSTCSALCCTRTFCGMPGPSSRFASFFK